MIEDNATFCEDAYQLTQHYIFWIILFVHFVISVVALTLAALVFLKFLKKKLFDLSFRVLSMVMLFYIAIFNLSLLGVTIFHTYYNLQHSEPCDILFYKKDCFWFVYPIFSSFCGLCFTQFALGLERVFKSLAYDEFFNGRPWLNKIILVIIAITLIISGPIYYAFSIFVNSMEVRLHCMGIIYKPDPNGISLGNVIYNVMLSFELVAIFLFLLAWRISAKKKGKAEYSVSQKLKINTNLLTIKLYLPQACAHTFFIVLFIAMAYILKAFRPLLGDHAAALFSFGLFCLPYFTIIQLILIVYMMKREDQIQKERFMKNLNATSDISNQGNLYNKDLLNMWK